MTTLTEARLKLTDRCNRCSQCKFVPVPKSQAHRSCCPSMDYVSFHIASGGGQLIASSALEHKEATYSKELLDAVSACTMCGACDTSCKVNYAETVEPLDGLYAFRAKIVADGQSPRRHREVMEKIADTGNSQGKPREARADWAKGLGFDSPCDVLLHVGSVLSYDTAKHGSLSGLAQTLQKAGVSLGYLGVEEGSCGMLAYDLGYQNKARALARAFLDQVSASGAKTVVTLSSSAISAYRTIYPRIGLDFGDVRVLHYTEYLLQEVVAGRLGLKAATDVAGKVAFHDTCKLGRLSDPFHPGGRGVTSKMGGIYASENIDLVQFWQNGVYEAPRALLRHMGIEVEELERNREASYCCGATGGVKESAPAAAKMAAQNRLAELTTSDSSVMVIACGNCAQHMGKHVRAPDTVLDLIDMLATNLTAKGAK